MSVAMRDFDIKYLFSTLSPFVKHALQGEHFQLGLLVERDVDVIFLHVDTMGGWV